MEFLIILLLLVLNGIFAMYEIALVSSSKARLETLAGKGNKSARGVLKQLEEPEKFLSTIQIGITLIGILSVRLVSQYLHPPAEQNHRRKERRTPDDTGRDQNDSPPKLRTGSDRQGRDGNAA